MQKKLSDTTITVPEPNHGEIRIGTLQSIIRQSGIPRSEFESSDVIGGKKKIESLPKRDQKALLHYLDTLVQKNVATG